MSTANRPAPAVLRTEKPTSGAHNGLVQLRGRTAPRTVVRTYGRDSLLIAVNPVLSAIEAAFGLRIGLRSDAEVRDRMEKDALAMQENGYRVVSAEEVSIPAFAATPTRASWYRVTYERADASLGDTRPAR